MARKIFPLKYPATCRDCGAALPVGARARYYGRGRVYGVDCHADTRTDADKRAQRQERTQRRQERQERRTADVVSTRCEDYPCCGHGPPPQGDGGGCPTRFADGTERFNCQGCGTMLEARATSALCGACRSGRRQFNWGPLTSDPDSFFYDPSGNQGDEGGF